MPSAWVELHELHSILRDNTVDGYYTVGWSVEIFFERTEQVK